MKSVAAALVGLVLGAGCAAPGLNERAGDAHGHAHEKPGGTGMRVYSRELSDPYWLSKAASFHGHLGPWVTVGAMIGHDAMKRFGGALPWDVEVICWMAPSKQQPPYSCILDGLQASTGATLGKRNIKLAWSPEVGREDRPVVYVMRKEKDGAKRSGLVYGIKDRLAEIMSKISPDRLEEISREIAGHKAEELFEIHELTAEELKAGETP